MNHLAAFIGFAQRRLGMGRRRTCKVATVSKLCRRCDRVRPHRIRTRRGKRVPESPCRRCSILAHVARKRADPVRTKLRNTYDNMIARCHHPATSGRPGCRDGYKDYGARGIFVCAEWRASFEAFARDMGPPPTLEHTIDREDNDGPYSKDNCKWSTWTEQNRNKSDNHYVLAFGEELTVGEWAERTGIPYTTIQSRLNRGWMPESALNVELPADAGAPF